MTSASKPRETHQLLAIHKIEFIDVTDEAREAGWTSDAYAVLISANAWRKVLGGHTYSDWGGSRPSELNKVEHRKLVGLLEAALQASQLAAPAQDPEDDEDREQGAWEHFRTDMELLHFQHEPWGDEGAWDKGPFQLVAEIILGRPTYRVDLP